MSRKTITALALTAAVAVAILFAGRYATTHTDPDAGAARQEDGRPAVVPVSLVRAWPRLHTDAGALQVTAVPYARQDRKAGVFRQHQFALAPAVDWSTMLAPVSSAFASLAICDLNQNGRWEIVTGGTLQATRIYEVRDGSGFHLDSTVLGTELDSMHDAQILCADFDGNGNQELLRWRLPAAGQPGVLLRTELDMATGTWQARPIPELPAGIAVNDIQLADLNHDGAIDMFLATGFAPGLTDPYAPWRKVSDLILLSTTDAAGWTIQNAESYWPGSDTSFASASARIVTKNGHTRPIVQSFNTTGQHATMYGASTHADSLTLHAVGGFSWAAHPDGSLLLSNMQYMPAREYTTAATSASTLARELAQLGKRSVSRTICDTLTTQVAAVLCDNMLQGQVRIFATDPANCSRIDAWFYRRKCLASYYSRAGTFTHPLSQAELQKQYREMQPHSGPFARLDARTLARLPAPEWRPAALTHDTPWALLLADLDLDGNEEVVYSNSYLTRYQSFLRVLQQSDNTYTDIAQKLGIVVPGDTRGLAAADLDGDGDLDLATNSVFGGLVVLENQLGGDSISVDLLVNNSRALARNAEIRLITKERTLVRNKDGRAWVSDNTAPLVLPLQPTELPAHLRIDWPDGSHDTIPVPTTNTLYRLHHGPLVYTQ